MSNLEQGKPTPGISAESGMHLTPKAILAIVIAAVALIFVFSNTGTATLSWLWLEFSAPIWMMLLILLGAGVAIGFYLGRRRYKALGTLSQAATALNRSRQ